MQNLTLSSFFINKNYKKYPFFNIKTNFNLKNSKFSFFFSICLYSQFSFYKIKLKDIFFEKSLEKNILINNFYIANDHFSNRFPISKDESYLEIKNCLFHDCRDVNSKGGAICVYYSHSITEVRIINSGFSNCLSKNGGSIYIITSQTKLKSC